MPTFIRLTEYRDSDSKEAGFFDPNNRHTANQNDFINIPGSPIAYWATRNLIEAFQEGINLGIISKPRQGMSTNDNDRFVKNWYEVDIENIKFDSFDAMSAMQSKKKWFPYNKGGNFRKWYGNAELVVNWKNDGEEIKTWLTNNPKDPKTTHWSRRIINTEYYFKKGITWALITTNSFGAREFNNGFLFDVGGSSMFPNPEDAKYILGLLNSNVINFILKVLNPTVNIQTGNIASLPYHTSTTKIKTDIELLTQNNILISCEEWDSRETSWDFRLNELIRHKADGGKMQSSYDTYCTYWREKFFQLHANEEELNRLFIEIYGLEEELTPDVALEDITILKSESKIVNDELVFNADEIARQLISYAVGCMFGRYSLDIPGLVIANQSDGLQEYSQQHNELLDWGISNSEYANPEDLLDATIDRCSFLPDDDNIIPVLEEEVFSDDIAARFERFVAVAFGEEFVGENLRWIEQSIGMDIRKYFVSEFYKDHVRRYKKRPIYWMVQSPKKGFSALIYMHRYQSDIMARVQTMYLREYLTKIESLIEHNRSVSNNPDSSAKDAKEAGKTLMKLEAKQRDALDFDRGDMSRIAALQIPIDLDDGVKVNYQKFKGVLPDIGLSKGED
jgi:hypothetical protein